MHRRVVHARHRVREDEVAERVVEGRPDVGSRQVPEGDVDSLFLAMPYFTITQNVTGNFNIDSYVGKSDVLPAGHFDEIAGVLWKKETWQGDIAKKIKSLIEIEINAHLFEVGGQIHIVKFTKKKGLKWVGGKKPPCN